jgi:hypothetical protein
VKTCYTVKEERNIQHTVKQRKANRIEYILCGNCLLKHVLKEIYKEREDEEEDLSSYWMALREVEELN